MLPITSARSKINKERFEVVKWTYIRVLKEKYFPGTTGQYLSWVRQWGDNLYGNVVQFKGNFSRKLLQEIFYPTLQFCIKNTTRVLFVTDIPQVEELLQKDPSQAFRLEEVKVQVTSLPELKRKCEEQIYQSILEKIQLEGLESCWSVTHLSRHIYQVGDCIVDLDRNWCTCCCKIKKLGEFKCPHYWAVKKFLEKDSGFLS